MKRITYEKLATDPALKDMRVIDVREQDEYDEVHVIGVELFPLSRLQKGELPAQDEREVAVICRSGARSETACKILEQAGWRECSNIEGGTLAAIKYDPAHVEGA